MVRVSRLPQFPADNNNTFISDNFLRCDDKTTLYIYIHISFKNRYAPLLKDRAQAVIHFAGAMRFTRLGYASKIFLKTFTILLWKANLPPCFLLQYVRKILTFLYHFAVLLITGNIYFTDFLPFYSNYGIEK